MKIFLELVILIREFPFQLYPSLPVKDVWTKLIPPRAILFTLFMLITFSRFPMIGIFSYLSSGGMKEKWAFSPSCMQTYSPGMSRSARLLRIRNLQSPLKISFPVAPTFGIKELGYTYFRYMLYFWKAGGSRMSEMVLPNVQFTNRNTNTQIKLQMASPKKVNPK